MNTRRQFLVRAPLGFLAMAIACRDEGKPQAARRAPAEAERVQDEDPVLLHPLRRVEQQRVRLAGERRAEEPMVQVGDEPSELRRQLWTRRDVADGDHPAPGGQPGKRPNRELLEEKDVGTIGAHAPDHLLEESPSFGRVRVAVEEVPGADKQGLRPLGT